MEESHLVMEVVGGRLLYWFQNCSEEQEEGVEEPLDSVEGEEEAEEGEEEAEETEEARDLEKGEGRGGTGGRIEGGVEVGGI